MSVKVDTIYPTDSRLTEILEFFCNYRRYFLILKSERDHSPNTKDCDQEHTYI